MYMRQWSTNWNQVHVASCPYCTSDVVLRPELSNEEIIKAKQNTLKCPVGDEPMTVYALDTPGEFYRYVFKSYERLKEASPENYGAEL